MMKKESIISEEKEDTYEKEIDRTPRNLAGSFHGTGRLLQQYRDPEYGTFVRRGTDFRPSTSCTASWRPILKTFAT